jgi:hypothetical protein
MATLNSYSLYQLNGTNQLSSKKDQVDTIVDEILNINELNEIKDYVSKHFGEIEGSKWFEYPALNKMIYVLNDENRVEICMLRDERQYYGKGWATRT